MGTDIHLYIEQKQTDGTWKRVLPPPYDCAWCDGTGKTTAGRYHETPGAQIACVSDFCDGGKTIEEYGGRNYSLFGILANVRNGYGVAGVDTGDGFQPIDDPRGLPKDLSFPPEPDYNLDLSDEEFDKLPSLGDHNFSWVSLAEVLAYDYTRVTRKRGVVDSASFAEWNANGKGRPLSYCGGCSGPEVKYVSNEQMQKLINDGVTLKERPVGQDPLDWIKATDGKNYFTAAEWRETYREAVGESWFKFLDACKQLGDPERVRLVFGFDS